MRQFALALIVGLLSFSATGISAVLFEESCGFGESQAADERDCPPTCVTCGCCAQGIEPSVIIDAGSFDAPVAELLPAVYRLVKSEPRDVLHVPKLRTAPALQ